MMIPRVSKSNPMLTMSAMMSSPGPSFWKRANPAFSNRLAQQKLCSASVDHGWAVESSKISVGLPIMWHLFAAERTRLTLWEGSSTQHAAPDTFPS
jgi:hypothetical protein